MIVEPYGAAFKIALSLGGLAVDVREVDVLVSTTLEGFFAFRFTLFKYGGMGWSFRQL